MRWVALGVGLFPAHQNGAGIWWWLLSHWLTGGFEGRICWAGVRAVVGSLSADWHLGTAHLGWVLPRWISRYLPGSSWQPGYPKCSAEISPGYKSLLVKCLTSSFQQGAVQSFPDSWDTVSHTRVKITQWHFSATLFTRWYKYKNISSHLTPWCFFLSFEHFRETGGGNGKVEYAPHILTCWQKSHFSHQSPLLLVHEAMWAPVFHLCDWYLSSAAAMLKQRPFHQHVHYPCSDNQFSALDSRGEWADLI